MNKPPEFVGAIARDGYAIIPGVLEPAEISRLIALVENVREISPPVRSRGGVYAIRNLLDVIPEIRRLATSPPILTLVQPILGSGAFPVRGILFDKPVTANWRVRWHQDLSIAVKERKDVPGFGPWSIKAGVLHVQPPEAILESMLAVRIHLDDCGESNAPLRVRPGSHRAGRLDADLMQQYTSKEVVSCLVAAGGVLLMRPLLLHASSAAKSPSHRRVIHLEYASGPLPGGPEWFAAQL